MTDASKQPIEALAPRILHLVSSDRWTGVAEPVAGLAFHQQALGCEVWLACAPSRSLERHAKRRALRVLTDLYLDRRLNPLHLIKDLQILARFVRSERIHVVHAHLIHDHWIAALALRKAKASALLVRTVHRAEGPHVDPFHRWLFDSATDLTIAISEESAGVLSQRLKLAPAATRVIYGGVDAERFHPGLDGSEFRREMAIPSGAPLGGIVARMVEGRGHRWLLESFSRAVRRVPDLHLVLVGRGPLKKQLRAEIARHPRREQIRMAGYRMEDLPQAYAAMDFHILLGQGSDGSCRAALEAMAAGKPNIVVRQGVLPETVREGQEGLLVEPNDVAGLAEALARLASRREEAAAMGRNARRAVEERFRDEIRAQETLAAYAHAWEARFGGRGLESPAFPSLAHSEL